MSSSTLTQIEYFNMQATYKTLTFLYFMEQLKNIISFLYIVEESE